MKHTSLVIGVILLISAIAAEAREPSELEQFYLELINRARANPNGEVMRLSSLEWGDNGSPASPNLNEGLPGGTISSSAKQPLAFSEALIDSASNYSDFLLAIEKFNHNENGTSRDRMAAAGYPFGHTWGSGENLALTTSTGPHPVDEERAEDHHANLFIDNNVSGRGHRTNLMDPDFREIGIAIRADSDLESFFPPTESGNAFINDVLSTQNFAHSNDRVFVTGVIFYDTNFNGFYDVGESAGQLDLEVKNAGNATVRTGSTFGSGGYSINMSGLPSGSYTILVTDSANDTDTISFSWGESTNVKADLLDPAFTAPPVIPPPRPSVHPTITYQPDAMLGKKVGQLIGNNVYSRNSKAQSVTQKAKKKKWYNWYLTIENDGNFPDRYNFAGAKGNKYVKIVYRDLSSGANATASFATQNVLDLGVNSTANYQIRMKPKGRAVGRKTKYFIEVRGTSDSTPSKIDSVRAMIKTKIRR